MSVSPIEGILIPPTPFVRHIGDLIMIDQLEVLDVGCCIGKSALYLASLGHNVTALDPDIDSLKRASINEHQNVQYLAADARNLPFKKQFDVVLMNEVLHQIPIEDHALVYAELNAATKPNGIHAISDYIGDNERALKTRQLYEQYANPNWEVIEYSEDPQSTIRNAGRTELTSLAKIVAIKR